MNLEQRVRDELGRAAPVSVPEPPTLDTLRSAVAGRRRRNRVMGGLAGAVAVVAVAGVLVANRPETPVEVVTADDGAVTATTVLSGQDVASDDGQAGASTGDETDTEEAAGGLAADDRADAAGAEDEPSTQLQAATTPVALETRASAVEFAGGSGVFVVATDDGYAGLASRFGGSRGVTMIGLASDDGLDWSEVGLSGVPAGATVTHLREFAGSYVALFSQFDSIDQRNVVTVATSTDLTNWTSVAVLPGDDVVATDLAVGPAGVAIIGDGRGPDVWTGPLAGPFERVGSIEGAVTVAGVVAIDDGFVAAGTADGSPTLFESSDGATWSSVAMSGLADDDAVVKVAVADGVIMIAGGGERAWAAASTDGGQTWSRSELDRSTVETVATSGRSMSFLGASPLGAPTVTITDGTTWSSAELDIAPGDRVELLTAGDPTILLVTGEDGLTWLVASR